MGRMLKETAAKSEQTVIQTMLMDLQKKWKTVGTKSAERQRKLEEALLFTGQLKEALHSMLEWLTKIEPLLSESTFVHGDIDNVRVLDEHHKALENDLSNRAANMSIVRKAARELVSSGEVDAATSAQMAELEQKWTTVQELADRRRTKLNDALRSATEFHQVLHSLIEWLGATEMKIRVFKALPDDVKDVQMAVFEIHEYQSEMQARQPSMDAAISLGNDIQTKCHPDSVATMRHWLKVLSTRWQEVDILMKQREQKLKDHMSTLERSVEELEQLLVWFFSVEASLINAEQQELPRDLENTKRLMNEHQDLETELYAKQMAVERLTQPRPQSHDSLQQLTDRKGRKTQSAGGARRPGEPAFPSDNARDLYYRNRDVTARAVQRRNQLQDHFSHMLEVEKLKGFQFEDWRRKFVRFMDVKKLRVMDFFRRYDTDRDGRLTRDEFITCILDEKFQTTELELEIVADIFDQNGDGLIDYQEFQHALKPDWKSAQNLTDADKIEDELTFQTRNCTCDHPHHYELQRKKDSSGAVQSYIFSENQQLRLVRILHTTIMVRVGGGWETLDKFLVKNDPCRIKGRTNIELRETFILPEGSSQAMTPFKNKKPSGIYKEADPSDPRLSSVGPISKIRVKTVNTTPWKAGAKSHETSSDPGGHAPHNHHHHSQIPHSHTHNHLVGGGGGLTLTANGKSKTLAGPKPVSRAPSRASSEAPEEQPSQSSHSGHSRSSSISSVSGPSVTGTTKTPSALGKTTNGGSAGGGGQNGKNPAAAKLNGNTRKR
ncbi:Microtubule-actin cross-linking factor 1 [Hypsibius exemplaris]|uniref:Microtubule-actin cross-linking factor 1 n=1 Tax=Hypsibius exemplaris TaxID=2072580 RepID=A0A9X6NI85_HYPEX|nr:Microtubule-actin cross-linking factor 1 [Hypsibius exemplaris]